MHYLIYKITNILTDKVLIGKYIGKSKHLKLTHSSNKFLLTDIKILGYKNFSKEIIEEFTNKVDLIVKFNLIIDDNFKQNKDTYNYKYIMSSRGKHNISSGRINKESIKLKNLYPCFIDTNTITRYKKIFYKIKNYCCHGDLIIKITTFNKIYSNTNNHYCEKCNIEKLDELYLSKDDIMNNLKKLKNILVGARPHSEKYIKETHFTIYKSILDWSKDINDIKFNERLFLAKHMMKNKPKCLCCENTVYFSDSHKSYTIYCYEHLNKHHTSLPQKELYEFIKSIYKEEIIENFKIESNEIDLYLPKSKLGIEFNGLYWHSDIFKKPRYHHDKWKLCKDNGIQLLTIWEDDWNFKQHIIKSIISHKLNLIHNKIYARKCIIKQIDFEESKTFLTNNHLQGDTKSKINLGLFYNNELVSIITFGKKRMILKSKSNKNEYELLRFCNKLNTSVIGGASKLFTYFINNFNAINIVSYASCDISNGDLYKILGFMDMGFVGINYWWTDNKRHHRSNFMKYKLVKNGADPNKTADEILRERKYFKIYGTGNLKYIWQREN